MLIQPDRNELGDKRLDPAETVAKKRQECLDMAAKKRLPHQEDLEDQTRALGPRLQFAEMVAKLKRIVPAMVVKDGLPGNVALYFPRNRKELEEATLAWQNDKDTFFLSYKYVGGFPKTELQEFSTVDVDNAMLATREHRGWRTVVLTLIKQGVVSYNAVVREFGDVGSDQRGWRWREQLRPWRNNPEASFS